MKLKNQYVIFIFFFLIYFFYRWIFYSLKKYILFAFYNIKYNIKISKLLKY